MPCGICASAVGPAFVAGADGTPMLDRPLQLLPTSGVRLIVLPHIHEHDRLPPVVQHHTGFLIRGHCAPARYFSLANALAIQADLNHREPIVGRPRRAGSPPCVHRPVGNQHQVAIAIGTKRASRVADGVA